MQHDSGATARRRRVNRAEQVAKPRDDIESLDYDIDACSIFEQEFDRQSDETRRNMMLARWIVCMIIGCCTGVVAFLIDVIGARILSSKFASSAAGADFFDRAFNTANRTDAGPASGPADSPMYSWAFGGAFASFVAGSIALVAVAAGLCIYVEPVSAGSGIPEVKTYLQGVKVPRLLRTGALVCKAVGVMFSVAAGLMVGKEGPMIHVGSVIAAGLSQGSSKTCALRTMWLKQFRNDHDKRDFVSAGAAAGVAAAFGAPIGGVLFAIEEAALYWSQALTWRTFFCAMCSTLTLNVLLSAVSSGGSTFGRLSHPGLITFGAFIDDDEWDLRELPVFISIGVICGLLGALFIHLNEKLTLWRMRNLTTKHSRFLEALCMAGFTAVLCMLIPFALPCVDTPTSTNRSGSAWSYEPNPLQRRMNALICQRGAAPLANTTTTGASAGRVSDLSNLLLGSHDEAIKTLFHRTASGTQEQGRPLPGLSWQVCLVFHVTVYWVALVTYGTMVPSGLFVPGIMMGASLGRLAGELMRLFFPDFVTASPGCYALIGAAGMLGGVCRMTISITVIILECTDHMSYLLPISLTILAAKVVGDSFNEGIYDLHVRLKRYPVMPEETPRSREHLMACDIATKQVHKVCEYERVSTLVSLLQNTRHHGFPVTAYTARLRAPSSHSTATEDGMALAGDGCGDDACDSGAARRNGTNGTNGYTPHDVSSVPEAAAEQGQVVGVILRSTILTILSKRHFEDSPTRGQDARRAGGVSGKMLARIKADDFLRPWDHDASVDDLQLTPAELNKFVDLQPYVNEAACVTLQHTSLRRVSKIFRSQGLRHLLVVENCPKLVGVITRRDIICGGEGEAAASSHSHGTLSFHSRGESVYDDIDVGPLQVLEEDLARVNADIEAQRGMQGLRGGGRRGSESLTTPLLPPGLPPGRE